ncbi:hypothetical protein AGOR_G00147140 [Albula goreensis]|uniref:Protein Largen n=1 Tax=Albula goreensis TaxID=1534307 RepID=A0A8T3D632_9TELE|nr:hypothetical protein AGOR_G00147140 [Albula goreensis]
MFSDSRQLGKHRVSQHNNTPQHWLRNGVTVHRESALMGQSARTETNHLPPDRRREMGLTAREERGNSHIKERNERNFDGQNLQRRLPIAEKKRSVQPDSVSQSGPWDLSTARWNLAAEQHQRRSSSVREPLRECVCSSHSYQTEPHPSGRKYVPPPPTGFKGQESCRVLSYVVERQFRGYARDSYQRGPHTPGQAHAATCSFNKKHGLNSTFFHGQEYRNCNHGPRDLTRAKNQPDLDCNGPSSDQGLIFSTEVPQRELDCTRHRGLCWPGSNMTEIQNKRPSTEQGQKREPTTDRPKISQASVRDQIQRVVGELEGVLGGLKQVHLEMKEVVEQIELLTSNIDLGEEDPSNSFPSDTLCSSSSSGVMVSSHKGVESDKMKRVDTTRGSLRSFPTHSNPPVLNPSVIMANQTAALSPPREPPGDRTYESPTMGTPPQGPPRDQNQESQSAKEGPCPTFPPPADQNQVQPQPAGHGPGRPACRSKKPPPYPHNGQVAKVGKGRESLKAPPYPVKRRLLSTMV